MQLPKGLLRRIVAGALFAALSIQLLYDLNPQIEISTARLVGVTLAYALYGGVLFGAILWGIRLVRKKLVPPDEPRPHGFGFIVLASVYCALVFWLHRHTFEIYLPFEAVRNLSRAAPILGILTVVLAALWLVERTALGWRRQILFVTGVGLIAITLLILSSQRAALEPARFSSVEAPRLSQEPNLVFVTIGYIPHDWIVRMDAEGTAPFFSETRDRGFFARIQPFPTTSRRSIWASLLTGKLAYRHGVTGRHTWRVPWEDEPFLVLPNGLAMRRWALPPASRTEVRTISGSATPLWELLELAGAKPEVVSVYGVEPEIRPTTLPRELVRRLQSRGSFGSVAREALAIDLALLDRAASSDHGTVFVHLPGLDRLQVRLGAGNELPGADSEAGALYRDYIAALGDALRKLSDSRPEAMLLVISPSAVQPNFAPQDPVSFARARISPESGEADGFIAATGLPVASTQPSVVIAELPDVVPTVLYGTGLPVGRDMDGGVISELFDPARSGPRPLQLIPSWESVEP